MMRAAAVSAGLATSALMAAASDGISTFAVCSKNGRVTSFSSTGNVYFSMRANAFASE